MPVRSMTASTPTSGISMSWNTASDPSLSSACSSLPTTARDTTAERAAALTASGAAPSSPAAGGSAERR